MAGIPGSVIRRGMSGRRGAPPAPRDAPRRITRPRVFRHVCIVFISPPRVELRVLSMYFACFVRVFVLFIDDTYCIHSAFSAPQARKHMLAASILTGAMLAASILTGKHCAIICILHLFA